MRMFFWAKKYFKSIVASKKFKGTTYGKILFWRMFFKKIPVLWEVAFLQKMMGKKYVPTGLNSQELLMIKTSSFSGLQRMPHADKYVDYDDTH